MAADLAYAIGLPPADAIGYFRGLGYQVSENALQAYDAVRARAFTVTGIAKLDVLQDIHGALASRLEDGGTYESFRADLDEVLRRRGWQRVSGSRGGLIADAATGEVGAQLPGWHLKTIFRNNMQSALSAGKTKQMLDQVDLAPFWQYIAIMDSKTRPSHAAANGLVFRYDDPFWQTHTPPCDHNCRCGRRALSEAMVRARGLDVLDGSQHLEDTDAFVTRDETRPTKAFVNPLTGARFVPRPGFGTQPDLRSWGDGANGLGLVLSDKLRKGDARLGAAVTAANPRLSTALANEYRQWALSPAATTAATQRVIAVASPRVAEFLAGSVGTDSAALSMDGAALQAVQRNARLKRGAVLSPDQVLDLPHLLGSPRAVLWDAGTGSLLYVVEISGRGGRRVVARVTTGQGSPIIESVTRMSVQDLRDPRYVLVDGSLEE